MKLQNFVAANWPAPEHVVAGTTVRTGGKSRSPYDSWNLGIHAGDSREAVIKNRERLAARLDLPGEPAWLRQVHGDRSVPADTAQDEPEADGSWTSSTGVVCVVLTADCLPVLLCDREGRTVGAAHAGWRGLSAGILENTVAAMSVPAESLMAWLGPAISQPAFEVGPEVREAFLDTDSAAASAFQRNAAGRWQADLYELARQRLVRTGVSAVYGGGRCTFREEGQFFSYRRDGQCGRMASVVFRR